MTPGLLHPPRRENRILWEAALASIVLHAVLIGTGQLPLHFFVADKHNVEIDITNMGRIGVPAAPKAAAAPPAPKPAAPQKEWVAPKANQKVAPAPVPTKAVAPPPPETPPPPANAVPGGSGEIGIGTGTGGEGQLSKLPQLLNLSDLGAILQRFYPEAAREDGREAVVVLDIHIGTDGKISNVEIVQSADPDFNDAAIRVARLLRFTPAYVGGQAVAVKMRQAIQFKLQR